MRINLISEIKNCIGNVTGFCLSVYHGGVCLQCVKQLKSYSKTHAEVLTEDKKIILVTGNELRITKYKDGDLVLTGTVEGVQLK